MFVGHREKDKHLSYSHEGWKGLTLHGLRPDATENYDQYGKSKKDIVGRAHVKNFLHVISSLKKLGYRRFDRVRIMKLEPGGYIMPHMMEKVEFLDL